MLFVFFNYLNQISGISKHTAFAGRMKHLPTAAAGPELELQQAASDVSTRQPEKVVSVGRLESRSLCQGHQLEVAANIRLVEK